MTKQSFPHIPEHGEYTATPGELFADVQVVEHGNPHEQLRALTEIMHSQHDRSKLMAKLPATIDLWNLAKDYNLGRMGESLHGRHLFDPAAPNPWPGIRAMTIRKLIDDATAGGELAHTAVRGLGEFGEALDLGDLKESALKAINAYLKEYGASANAKFANDAQIEAQVSARKAMEQIQVWETRAANFCGMNGRNGKRPAIVLGPAAGTSEIVSGSPGASPPAKGYRHV